MSIKGDLIAIGLAGVVLIGAAWYAKKKIGDAVDTAKKSAVALWDDAAQAVDNAVDAVGTAAVNATGTAIKGGALDVPNTIRQMEQDHGWTQEQATWAELAAMGGMGA